MAFDPSTATPLDPSRVPVGKTQTGLKAALAMSPADQANNDRIEALPETKVAYNDAVNNLKPPRSAAEAQAQDDLRANPPPDDGFDPSTAQAFDPSSAQEVTPAAPRRGAAAIPTAAEEAGQPYAPPPPAAPQPEPTIAQKVVGGIEAGLNVISSLTNYGIGLGSGIVRAGIVGGAEEAAALAARADQAARGVSAPLPEFTPAEQSIQQEIQNVTVQPQTPTGKQYTESAQDTLAPVMESLPALVGHGHDMAAAPEIAQQSRVIADTENRPTAPPLIPPLERPELEGIRAAHDAGYVLTPKAAQAGVGPRVAQTVSGSARLASDLAARNAENTARLAAEDVGIPADTPVTPEATADVRQEAGKAYAAVQDVGAFENDAQYDKDLTSIGASVKQAAEDYPESKLADHPILAAIEGLRTDEPVNTGSAIEMVKQLRSKADVAYRAGDNRLGGQYRDLAGAVDDSMDRALGRMADDSGDPTLADAVDQYRAARVTIAKSYLLDDAMKGALKPGEVNAMTYARALDKGVPLSGPALQIANFGKQFGGEGLAATKSKSGHAGPAFSDIALTALMHPASLAGDVATAFTRPAVRAVLGSKFMQKRMAGGKPLPETEAPPGPPPELTTSLGAGGGSGGAPPAGPGPLGDLTPDWSTTPGVNGPARPGTEPGLVPTPGEQPPMRLAPGGVDLRPRRTSTAEGPQQPGIVSPPRPMVASAARRAGAEIPAVEGRPGLPEAAVTGAPAESAATEPSGAAMQEPGAVEARRQQRNVAGSVGPSEAETQRLLSENPSSEVKRVLEEHLAAVREADKVKAQQAADNIKAGQLEQAARTTLDKDLQARLLKEADALRGAERIPVGQTAEGQPEIPSGAPTKPLPVGKAIEGEPAAAKVPTPKATERPMTEDEWKTQFKLGDQDAERAKAVAQALQHDPEAVEKAAVQHENSPRAFDRAVQEIIDANETEPAAGGSEGVPGAAPGTSAPVRPGSPEGAAPVRDQPAGSAVPAAERGAEGVTQPEPVAAVRAADEHARPDGFPEAGRGSVQADRGSGQGAGEQQGPGGAGLGEPNDTTAARPAEPSDLRGQGQTPLKGELSDEAFKTAEQEKAPFANPEALEAHLRDALGNKLIDGLQAQGLLRIANSLDEGKKGAGGIMRQPNFPDIENMQGTHATLYYNEIGPHNAAGVLMHELGEHFGVIRLLGKDRYATLLKEVKQFEKSDDPELKQAWQDVKDRYVGPDTLAKISDTDHPDFLREVAARLVETKPDLPFVRRLVNDIRVYFYTHFGTTLGTSVDAGLIRGLAASALRKAAAGEFKGQTATAAKPAKTFTPMVAKARNDGFPPLFQ